MEVVGRPDTPSGLGSVHVLVVDDSPEIRDYIVRVLQTLRARVTDASTAEEALALLQRHRPDVLLSDLEMPEHDGLWLIEQVRRLTPARGGVTPAACLTGLTGPEDRARVLRAGFQYHVPKPFEPDALLGIVALLALKPSPDVETSPERAPEDRSAAARGSVVPTRPPEHERNGRPAPASHGLDYLDALVEPSDGRGTSPQPPER
jgi:CheY-like chemotaxis protein